MKVFGIRLDGQPLSEYRIHVLAAATVGVLVVLVTGDRALCDEVAEFAPSCRTLAISEGAGASTTSLHPAEAMEGTRAATEEALRAPRPSVPAVVGPHRLEITYRDASAAYARSHSPGTELLDDHTVALEHDDFDVLRTLIFLVGL